jgi:hypothetical protein
MLLVMAFSPVVSASIGALAVNRRRNRPIYDSHRARLAAGGIRLRPSIVGLPQAPHDPDPRREEIDWGPILANLF